jgi:hypothetical protein
MRAALIVGLGVCALGLAACGDVDLVDAHLNTMPLWTIRDGTASLVMPRRSTLEPDAVLRIDNRHLSYSLAYDQDLARETPSGVDWSFSEHRQGAIDSVLEYSDDDSNYAGGASSSRDR